MKRHVWPQDQAADQSVSAVLLQQAEPYWNQYCAHPFVRALALGTLDQEKYLHYMIQDYMYLQEYGKCFALGMEKGKDPEFLKVCRHYLQRIGDFELEVHRGSFAALGITWQQLQNASPSLENLGYTSYMLMESMKGGQAEILTSILACACSYEFIARKMVQELPQALDHPLYGDWFAQYTSDNYHEENVQLCALLDHLSKDYDEAQKNRLLEIFMNCSFFEMGFWNGAWNMRDETGTSFAYPKIQEN